MKVFHFGAPAVPAFRTPVVTIGNFDGVHLGHQALLRQMAGRAQAINAEAVAVTFDPHPAQVLQQRPLPFRLTTLPEKAALMKACGLAGLMVCRFDAAFAALAPREFLDRVILQPLQPSEIMIGEDFRFGRGRAAGVDDLRAWCAGQAAVRVITKLAAAGQIISSTAVRRAVSAGDLALAAALLGRRFAISGPVVGGDQVGRTLGYPTANLEPEGRLLPPAGVYASWAHVQGDWRQGATYIGTRPTFNGQRLVIETNIIGAPPLDLYGQTLCLELVRWIRGDMKFENLAGLERQIAADVAEIRRALAAAPAAAPHACGN